MDKNPEETHSKQLDFADFLAMNWDTLRENRSSQSGTSRTSQASHVEGIDKHMVLSCSTLW
jgi:hypothetical protein